MARTIRIGTRGSELALWQADYITDILSRHGFTVERRIIKTRGDAIQHIGFDKMEGKGFFTKELEEALLNDEADLAVHSCKDLETTQPEGLALAAYVGQEDPRDLLLVRKESVMHVNGWPVKTGATLGTSSARRRVQLLAHRPDLVIADLRGNVPTRVQRLREGTYDAIVLAAAGLNRLGLDLSDLHGYPLPVTDFVPAAAQGVLALQVRANDTELMAALHTIWPQDVSAPVFNERHYLNRFEGGCKVPLGVHVSLGRVRISWAPDRDTPARRISVPAAGADEAAVIRFVKTYNGHHSCFYSSSLNDDVLQTTLEAYGVAYTAHPLIQIELLDQREPLPETEWVFFASSNAVKASLPFLAGKQVRFAAVGPGTASALLEAGLTVSYTGTGGDTAAIARAFAEAEKPESVLLPQSARSGGNVAAALEPLTQVHVREVYRTVIAPESLERHDVLIFTSPSNVESFLAANQPDAGQIAIAIGPSTQQALSGWPGAVMVAENPTPFALADALGMALYMLWAKEA
jgi:hydroxymethylbilane synthase